MDAQRFDNLARTLAGRLSRRNALRRAGAAASASLLAASGLRPERAQALVQAQAEEKPLYTIIRRYALDGPTGRVRKALQAGYVEAACKAPGFVAYFTVEDEDGDFATVAIFRSQDDLEKFADDEAAFISQNLGNLLPAPEEAISGDTYIHAAAQKAFSNICPAAAPQNAATVAPPSNGSLPTAAPSGPTAVPSGPTPTPAPACGDQGCVCSTGTQSPCNDGLVCCPTTDLLGGPGVCQPEAVCYPDECRANDRACPRSCGTAESCPNCCSNYCNADGVCADSPGPPCTGDGCACTTGTQSLCDSGLVCCGTTSALGGPGVCQTEAECNPPCTAQGCACNGGVQGNCDQGLVCCQEGESIPGGAGTCQTEAECAPPPCTGAGCDCTTGTQSPCDDGLVCCGTTGTPGGPGTCQTEAECNPPCTGEGCACNGGVQGACDDGLVCCQEGESIPGGAGTCETEANCAPPPCTGEGCACNGGVQGACDDGLVCCQDGQSIPGGAGTCTAEANCAPPPCTGETCPCNGGVEGACDDGLICCQTDPSIPGGSGTCQAPDFCGPPPCTDNGVGCDSTCNWGDSCAGCCSGFCDDTGVCGDVPPPPVVCTSAGCACDTGTEAPCDDGLTCCQSGDVPGGPGVCQAGC